MPSNLLEELYRDAVIDVSLSSSPKSRDIPHESRATTWEMAKSATKAAVKFAAGGMQRVSESVREERLRVCRGCLHFDGAQCAVCGCVIAVKTWFPAETCPVGNWPDPAKAKAR